MRRLLVLLVIVAMVTAQSQTTKILGRRIAGSSGACTTAFLEAVTQVTNFQSGTSGTTETLTITLAAGNGAVVMSAYEASTSSGCDASTDVAITDTGGNTYTSVLFAYDSGNQECAQVFYSGITTGGTLTVTSTFAIGTPAWRALAVAEYSGVLAGDFGTASGATPVSATSAVAGWATPTIVGASESTLIGANFHFSGGATNTNAASGGATERFDPKPLILEDKICTGGSATVAGSITGSTSNISIGFALKRAP